jgi:hypothetical protein
MSKSLSYVNTINIIDLHVEVAMSKARQTCMIDSSHIRDILPCLTYDSCLVLDLDNTVFEPRNQEIGSDQWFSSYIEFVSSIIPDKDEARLMVIAIYNSLQQQLQMQPVERNIVTIIKLLQIIGIPVIALTARGKNLEGATYRQLDSIHINLRNNVIFCDGKNKGECFKDYLLSLDKLPARVVMADDKKSNLLHVKNAVESLGLQFNGVRYSRLDNKVKQFDISKAQIELSRAQETLPFSTRLMINKVSIFSRKQIRNRHHSNCYNDENSTRLTAAKVL